jgi:hypothetical protein
MMVADPLAYAVTMPALALGVPPVLVFTGKESGKEDIQVVFGSFVRSRTNGTSENVPIARNWPVSCRLPTVSELGTMVSESSGSGAAVTEMLIVALAVTTVLSGFVHIAVIVVFPGLTPFTTPVELTEAMVGMLELHVRFEDWVTFS